MKFIVVVTFLLSSCIAYSQNSYYFSSPIPSTISQVSHVDSKLFGSYSSLQQPSKYIVDENGIALVSTVISSISRETIRESSKYFVRKGYIHGVVEKDSLPCVLKGEYYFFGIQNKEVIIGNGSQNVLTKIDENGNYIINTFENGQYIPLRIIFTANTLSISYFDYDFDTKTFNFIDEQKTIEGDTDYKLIVLSPTEKEMKKLLRAKIWEEAMILKKN